MATLILYLSATVILLLASLVMIAIKRYRKSGLKLLAAIIILDILLAFYIFLPRRYSRLYTESSREWRSLELRGLADSLDFHLGCIPIGSSLLIPEISNNFNSITPENALKMGPLLKDFKPGEYDFTRADKLVDEALSNNLRVRGHTLIWGKQSDMFKSPDLASWLESYPEEERGQILEGIMENHITTVLNHFRGRVPVWDVVNEPMSVIRGGKLENNVYLKYLGDDYITTAFRLARQIDPDIKLYLNENFYSYTGKQAEGFLSLLRKFKENNVPLDGVGIQCHITPIDTSVTDFSHFMKSITDMGLEVEITEMDIRLRFFGGADDPYEAQGNYYGRLLSACLENPMCKGLTFWGLSDSECWMDKMPLFFPKPNEPYMFDSRMNPKPVFYTFYRILSAKVEEKGLQHHKQD